MGDVSHNLKVDVCVDSSKTYPMKRILVTLKKRVDPEHKLIATEWITEDEVKAIRKKYGSQFDPDEPIINFLSDQLMLVSFAVWIHE